MTDDTDTPDPDRIERLEQRIAELERREYDPDHRTTRRKLLGGLAAGGILGAVGTASAQETNVGGGTMSDEYSDAWAPMYEETAGNIDPGVAGRYFRVEEPGNASEHGKLLRDTGSALELPEMQFGDTQVHGSLGTEDTTTETLQHDFSEWWPVVPNPNLPNGPIQTQPTERVTNPILAASDFTSLSNVTDPDIFADPFAYWHEEDGRWFCFGELFDRDNTESNIAYATAQNLSDLSPTGVVFGSPSSEVRNYPYTFRAGGRIFQTHHTSSGDKVVLHELEINGTDVSASVVADPFFTTGTFSGQPEDPIIIRWRGRWWLFVHTVQPSPDEKHAFYKDGTTVSDLLNGSWTAHDSNPVVASDQLARNAGRPIPRKNVYGDGGWIELPCRGSESLYSKAGSGNTFATVRSISINELTPSSFSYTETANSPIVVSDPDRSAWNGRGMHHIDPVHGQYALVDGKGPSDDYQVGVVAISSAQRDPFESLNDEHKQKVAPQKDDEGESVTHTWTVERDVNAKYELEVQMYRDDESGANNDLELTFEGISDGEYAYTLVDESASGTRHPDENQIVLIRPTASNSIDTFSGGWTFNLERSANRVGVRGSGTDIVRGQGQTLTKGTTTVGGVTDPFDVTLSASASAGESVRVVAVLWKYINRTRV